MDLVEITVSSLYGFPVWKWKTRTFEAVRAWAWQVGFQLQPLLSDWCPLVPTVVQDLQQAISKLEARLNTLEKSSPAHRVTAPQTQVSLPAWEGASDMWSWLLSLPAYSPSQD